MSDAPIVPVEQAVPQEMAISPRRLSELALDPNVDATKLGQLLEIQLKWEANEARKQFDAALAVAKKELPDVLRNKHVRYTAKGQLVEYDYPTLDNIVKTIAPVLAKHGLSHRWIYPKPIDGCIKVSCVLTGFGHTEIGDAIECKIEDPMSMGAAKALAATKTMLERLTFSGAMGIASRGSDTDGPQTVEAAKELEGLEGMLKRIVASENLTQLEQNYKEAFKKATAEQNFPAMKMVVEAKDQRKAELIKEEPAQ